MLLEISSNYLYIISPCVVCDNTIGLDQHPCGGGDSPPFDHLGDDLDFDSEDESLTKDGPPHKFQERLVIVPWSSYLASIHYVGSYCVKINLKKKDKYIF